MVNYYINHQWLINHYIDCFLTISYHYIKPPFHEPFFTTFLRTSRSEHSKALTRASPTNASLAPRRIRRSRGIRGFRRRGSDAAPGWMGCHVWVPEFQWKELKQVTVVVHLGLIFLNRSNYTCCDITQILQLDQTGLLHRSSTACFLLQQVTAARETVDKKQLQ